MNLSLGLGYVSHKARLRSVWHVASIDLDAAYSVKTLCGKVIFNPWIWSQNEDPITDKCSKCLSKVGS